jgi:hypothetical protein
MAMTEEQTHNEYSPNPHASDRKPETTNKSKQKEPCTTKESACVGDRQVRSGEPNLKNQASQPSPNKEPPPPPPMLPT